jgi:tetratricopeptide (TPR) repeat protein
VVIGEQAGDNDSLDAATNALRAALAEMPRDQVPLQWATTQNNLGAALAVLGERESGTARLEEAVAAYGAALEEMTRDRVPLQWATSTGNQGMALMLLAERLGDATRAQSAVQQIEVAFVTLRDGGNAAAAAHYEAPLPKARALFKQLTALNPAQ